MAQDKPNSDSPNETSPAPIDPEVATEAIREVNEAMAILPKKRFGCLVRFAKPLAILFVMLAGFVYWNFLRTPALKISKETTYLTGPLTSDGSRVDYFTVLEKELYSPDTKTDDNGYRQVFRALGDADVDEKSEAHAVRVYAKLGLDPAEKPTMSCVETYEFFRKYCEKEGLHEEQVWELDAKVHRPWTLDELPMMEPWLEENGPVIDLIGEAVRKPVFRIPIARTNDTETLNEALMLGDWERPRIFARMLSTRAYYRIGTGDIDGAIDDVVACHRLGRQMERQGTLIERLVGIAIRGIAGAKGVAGNPEVQPTAEQLQRLVDEILALPPRPPMARVLLTERYHALDAVQAMAHGDKSLADVFGIWDPVSPFMSAVVDNLSVDWNVVMTEINSRFDAMESKAELEPPDQLSARDLIRGLFLRSRSRRVADLIEALCIPSIEATREANRRSMCADNLRPITLAMLLYECEHGVLPPAYTVDAEGKPLHSWRVILLPYLGEEELYAKLRLDEPWDSEHNCRFHEIAVGFYQCPTAELSLGQTTYSVVIGKTTAFEGAEGKALDGFGVNLMLVTEREQPVCWMDPGSELSEAVAIEGINCREPGVHGIESHHPGGVQAGFRSGGVRFISETIDRAVLQGLLDGTAEELP